MSILKATVGRTPGRLQAEGRACGRLRGLQLLLLMLCAGLTTPSLAFQMQGFDGSAQFLHDRTGNGQWTLVMIWSLDCIPCEQQKPMISDFHRSHVGSDAIVVGVATDGPDKRTEVQARLGAQVPALETLLAYPDVFARQYLEETGRDFRVTPSYLLYEPDGQLAGVHAGPITREALENVIGSKR